MKSHGSSARDAVPSAMQRRARVAHSHRSSPDHVARPAALDLKASPSIVVRPSSVQLRLHVATLRDVSCAALRGTAAIIAPCVRPAHDERRDVARPRRARSATGARRVRRAHGRGAREARQARDACGERTAEVIYRTTLVRTFQVVTICRVDKSEVLVVLISPHDLKRH
ncbi:hypothetical protein F511_07180 [Dorcoceras hygrometricum]|uniref:Uncharacterized protein n=1 Tax=Dorcoceras hygrometricum TaxID=472368 RepID=A0A2Z7AQ89_9LAMI|nr:hypothetical protein F511_07180 [Dorcoceras hygrometricum]